MTSSSVENPEQPLLYRPLPLKLTIPPVHPGHLVRTRLLRKIDEALRGKALLLIAPGGFGKTTVLSQWANEAEQKTTWLTVDKYDNDPAFFLRSLVAALQSFHKSIGKDVFHKLHSDPKPSIESILEQMLTEAGMVMSEMVLIVDDYHLIHSQPVHNMLGFIIEHLPPQLHVIIATRIDPPFELSKLRAHRQLREFRSPYLNFTMDEAGELLNDVMQLQLSYGDITALVQRCEGVPHWIKYAGLILENTSDPREYIATLEQTPGDIGSILTKDLFNRQAAEVRTLLQEMATLPFLNPPLCQFVCGEAAGETFLEELSAAERFVTAIDAGQHWYRFHEGVQEFLWQGIRPLPPERLDELHRLAAQWMYEQGFLPYALEHALAGSQLDTAAAIIEEHAMDLLQQGYLVTITGWFSALPEEIFRTQPMLSVIKAYMLIISQQYELVEPVLQQALKAADSYHLPERILEHVTAIREYLAKKHYPGGG